MNTPRELPACPQRASARLPPGCQLDELGRAGRGEAEQGVGEAGLALERAARCCARDDASAGGR